ncbi:hypothetical protein Dimus_014770 [Dionaea muscipula]
MKERGKEQLGANGPNGEGYVDDNNNNKMASASELPCKKHPPSSSDGICAYCLRDKLLELVCPECGEQRLSSSCSCLEISSNPNYSTSCCNEVGSTVGRISFLIENEKGEAMYSIPRSKPSDDHEKGTGETDHHLWRSYNSRSLDSKGIKRKTRIRFWKIGRVFGRKREKGAGAGAGESEKNEFLVSDFIGVPRSRSLCSFRGGGGFFFESTDQESGGLTVSSAPRVSSVSTGLMVESAKRSCFSESEARISSNFDCEIRDSSSSSAAAAAVFLPSNGIGAGPTPKSNTSSIFSWKEITEDPRFIDLKLELRSEAKTKTDQVPAAAANLKKGGNGISASASTVRGLELLGTDLGAPFGMLRSGSGSGSCRVTFSEREVKKCSKTHKMWRWFFK